jgi:hypothetical protein
VGIDSFLVTPSRLIHRQDGVIRDRGNVHDNIVITPLSEVSDTVLRIDNVANLPRTDDLTVTFDPQLTPEQIVATLTALADYYRACGGIGLPADFKSQEAVVPEDIHV